MMIIRVESETDIDGVRALNTAAFETSAEAKLVDILRAQAHPIISLVSEVDGIIVGHILFSPVTLEGDADLLIMGLGPMAAAPTHQRKGIGTALVREGLAHCRQAGAQAVVVLGHPTYYPRFGFKPSSTFGIRSTYDVPEDVFMVMELHPHALRGKNGLVRYHPAFNEI
jgi:putative acetyltransferase